MTSRPFASMRAHISRAVYRVEIAIMHGTAHGARKDEAGEMAGVSAAAPPVTSMQPHNISRPSPQIEEAHAAEEDEITVRLPRQRGGHVLAATSRRGGREKARKRMSAGARGEGAFCVVYVAARASYLSFQTAGTETPARRLCCSARRYAPLTSLKEFMLIRVPRRVVRVATAADDTAFVEMLPDGAQVAARKRAARATACI